MAETSHIRKFSSVYLEDASICLAFVSVSVRYIELTDITTVDSSPHHYATLSRVSLIYKSLLQSGSIKKVEID